MIPECTQKQSDNNLNLAHTKKWIEQLHLAILLSFHPEDTSQVKYLAQYLIQPHCTGIVLDTQVIGQSMIFERCIFQPAFWCN